MKYLFICFLFNSKLFDINFEYRYKLDIEVENCNVRASFVFWDRECAQLLNQSAEQLRAKMIKVKL
jgi:hypothetical protein